VAGAEQAATVAVAERAAVEAEGIDTAVLRMDSLGIHMDSPGIRMGSLDIQMDRSGR
jgi:hypothetical protein